MSYETSTTKTKDGLDIVKHHWEVTDPKAKVFIVHGLAEHAFRYDHVAKIFNDARISVIGYDQRGHGKSEGIRSYFKRFNLLLDDLDIILSQENDELVPNFLYGHSMGGLVVAKYGTERNTQQVKGIITTGAALQLDKDLSPLLLKIAPILSAIFPKLPTQALDKNAISRDPAEVEKYISDPLIYIGGVRARVASEMIATIKDTGMKMDRLKLPSLLMHGTADKLTNPDGTRQLYQLALSTDKELKLWDGLYHELINEPEKTEVINHMLQWILQRS